MSTLSKIEKLKGYTLIQSLFADKLSVKSYPFIVVYKFIEKKEVPILFGVSVSKRNFKNATDRNRIKRLIREAYRLHKDEYYNKLNGCSETCAVMFLYIGKDMPDYASMEKSMGKALNALNKKISCGKL